MDGKSKKRQILEEEFIDEQKKLNNGIETINERMGEFRRENIKLLEKFNYYTKDDDVSRSNMEWKLQVIEEEFYRESNKRIQKLEAVSTELTQSYEKSLIALDKS